MRRWIILFFAVFAICTSCANKGVEIRGWNILSTNHENAIKVIETAPEYDINHLQLSHHLVMDLRHMKDSARCAEVNFLTDLAHEKGIDEVVIWDHALYKLSYYPEEFRTGPKGMIDLDNPAFWDWFKNDYREMMALVPNVDGLVLTFIETGARAEKQYSERMEDSSSKLAAVINAVSDVVCEELNKKLYVRTFSYTEDEYVVISECISKLKNKDIVLMMKETPHDFFLTHTDNSLVKEFPNKTLMEFDAGNEFNGQGVIINTWPEHFIKRWNAFKDLDNVCGYVARTDRYKTTHVIDSPSEILLLTLKEYTQNNNVTADEIYDEFIVNRYGVAALPYLKPAFQSAYDIVTSVLYTLGTNSACHSGLNYEPYSSSYNRHVSGKWIDPPTVFVKHNINKEFHYWKDVIEHLSPGRFKDANGMLKIEYPRALKENWVTPSEQINSEYLKYVYTEKLYGINLAEKALELIQEAKNVLEYDKYVELNDIYERTLLTAKLHKATFTAILGYRLYVKNNGELDNESKRILEESLSEIPVISQEISNRPGTYPVGQWDWKRDAREAMKYYDKMTNTGWKDYNNVKYVK